jgi:hypothetical protein
MQAATRIVFNGNQIRMVMKIANTLNCVKSKDLTPYHRLTPYHPSRSTLDGSGLTVDMNKDFF